MVDDNYRTGSGEGGGMMSTMDDCPRDKEIMKLWRQQTANLQEGK